LGTHRYPGGPPGYPERSVEIRSLTLALFQLKFWPPRLPVIKETLHLTNNQTTTLLQSSKNRYIQRSIHPPLYSSPWGNATFHPQSNHYFAFLTKRNTDTQSPGVSPGLSPGLSPRLPPRLSPGPPAVPPAVPPGCPQAAHRGCRLPNSNNCRSFEEMGCHDTPSQALE
jgi:hypothetical protein